MKGVLDSSIAAFCIDSDEEDDDGDVLLYLPVAPEIDEPEDGWPLTSEPVCYCTSIYMYSLKITKWIFILAEYTKVL